MEETQRGRRGRSDSDANSFNLRCQKSFNHEIKVEDKSLSKYNKERVGINLSNQMGTYASALQKDIKGY